MEYKLFRAKTVNDAITDALIEFEITSDMLDYEIVEEGSSGLLGLFSKDAVIKAKRKEILQEEPEIEFSIKEEFSTARVDFNASATIRKSGRPDKKKTAPKKDTAAKGISGKDEPFELKPETAPESDAKLDISTTVPEPKATKTEGAKEHRILTGEQAQNPEVNSILNLLFDKLEIQADIVTTIDVDDRVVNVNIIGEDTGDIIGKKGQTLDAVQYLISIIVNKKKGDYYRVKVDTNNYRERRQKTLENQAKNVAAKVKKTRRKVVMEPMNPYERRIIHSYLQSDKSVTTKSEGEEPNRKVVVYYKRS